MNTGRDKFTMLYVICCCFQNIFFLCPILWIYWDTSVNLSHCRSVQQCEKEFRLGRSGLSGRITILYVHIFLYLLIWLVPWMRRVCYSIFQACDEWSYRWRLSSLQQCTKIHHCVRRQCNFCNPLKRIQRYDGHWWVQRICNSQMEVASQSMHKKFKHDVR